MNIAENELKNNINLNFIELEENKHYVANYSLKDK